jgi:Cu/Ag efflux protein CusF
MKHTKSLHLALAVWLVALAVMVVITASQAAAAQQGTKGIAKSSSTTAKATIVAIDKENRVVTLRGPKGNDVLVHADERVQRFNDLKVGDVITATYSDSIAVNVRKPGTAPPQDLKQNIVRDSNKVGATITDIRNVSVKITAIDMTTSSITAVGPKGNSYAFKVKDKKNLKDLKVGDNVDISYTEALLLQADPAK